MNVLAVTISVVTFVCPPVIRDSAPPSITDPAITIVRGPAPPSDSNSDPVYRLPVIPSAPCQ